MHLSGLYVYPVKSLRGCAVESAAVDPLGLVGDRRFLVVDDTGLFLTQRSHRRMALVDTALTPDALILSATGAGAVSVSRQPDPTAPLRTVTVWKSEGLLAEDCGAAVAAWLTAFLGTPARLVRIGEKFSRPILKPIARPGDAVMFADAYPFLVISESTLFDLNDRLVARGEDALPMDRFRPNFVVTGPAPYAEDTWPRFRLSGLVFRAGGPCARCIMTTTDQQTAAVGKEPLRTLASYRRDAVDPTRINFGQNLIHETKSGIVRLGDPVEVLWPEC
jgi:MOSC domain-containing protein